MAIYYVDPYINAAVGGIQGTNVPSARTGTWADPFSALDILNGSTSITTINGVTINSGDEIRFKGLPSFEDFVYGKILTTYVGFNSRNISAGADQTTFSNWKTALNANIGSYRGPFFVSDTDHTWPYENITSTDIPKGLVMGQCSNSTTTTSIAGIGSTTFNLGPIFESQRGNLYLKLIKPTHVIKQTSTQSNIINIAASVTYSAGWTSETTQDGQTVFAMMQNGSGAGIFGYSVSALNPKLDLERFHFFRGNYAGDSTTNSTFDFRHLAASYTHRIGTISCINTNAWSYFYFNSTSKTNISLKIGVYSDYYVQHQTYSNGGGSNNNVTISTYHGGLGQYRFSDITTSVTLGNLFVYSQYTGGSMIYFGSSTSGSDTKFLDKSYLYAVSSMPLVASNYSGTITYLGSVYNFQSTEFQTAMPGATGSGPLVGGIKGPLGTNSPQPQKTLLNPPNWNDRLLYSCFGPGADTTYIYSYGTSQINSNMGILETNGVDYKANNSYIPIRVQGYMATNTWGNDFNYTFESNTFDKKVISTTTNTNTSVGSIYIPLLCYNDINNNLVIQCNSNANIDYHAKKVSLGYIDITGKTTLNISAKISKNINFSVTSIPVVVYTFKGTSGTETNGALSSTYDSGTLTWTFSASILTSAFISTSSQVGLTFSVYNTAGGFNNTYTIKDIQYTLT